MFMACTDKFLLPFLRPLSFLLLIIGLAITTEARARDSDNNYRAGTAFIELPIPIMPAKAGTIEVTELFTYACRHCFRFEPLLETWLTKLPPQVVFKRVPVAFGDRTWQLYAQVYFAVEQIGALNQVHTPFFDAIHKEKQALKTLESVSEFFTSLGVNQKDFEEAFESKEVYENLSEARSQASVYQIYETPTLIVAGKYRIENRKLNGQLEILQVVDFLIERELERYRLGVEGETPEL